MKHENAPRKRAKRQDNTGAYWHAAKEGRWRAQFYDAAGRLRHLSARSEQEIVNKLDRSIVERDHGTLGLSPNETPSLGDWMDTWLESKYQLKRKTVLRYRTDIDLYIKPALGDVRVDQVKAPMIEMFYGRLAKEHGLSPTSIKHVHATLSAALNTAYRHDVVTTQVMAKVSAPRVPVTRKKTMDDESVKKFLEAAEKRGLRCSLRWRLALLWGIRQGEALGLRWQDIDLVAGNISISQQRQYFPGEGMVEDSLKSASSDRSFRLDPRTTQDLRRLRKEQLSKRMLAPQWTDLDLVFCTDHGRPIDAANDRRQFKRILTECGLGDYRVHDARHTAITALTMDGIPISAVQDIAGHSDIRVTSSYVHPTAAAKDAAADKIQDRFG